MDHALGNQHQGIVLYRKIEHTDPLPGRAGFEKSDIVHGLPVGRHYPIQLGNDILKAMDLVAEFILQPLVHIDDAVFGKLLEYLPVFLYYLPVCQLIIQMQFLFLKDKGSDFIGFRQGLLFVEFPEFDCNNE
jgi:hypothetical protein